MDNLQFLILMSLLSFGVGHAIFRGRIGFFSLILLTIILVPVFFQIYAHSWYPVVIISFVVGFGFAHREIAIEIIQDVIDGSGNFIDFINRKKNQEKQTKFDEEFKQRTEQEKRRQWEEEAARREQEAKAKREREQQKENQSNGNKNKKSSNQKQSKSQNYNKNTNSTKKSVDLERVMAMFILGIKEGFTQQELKIARGRKAKEYHFDKNISQSDNKKKELEKKMKEVNWAYNILRK